MNLKAWEATIDQMVEEASQEPKEAGKQKVILAWRRKLENSPTSLEPYQIDSLVREVRRRLAHGPLQPQ